MGKRAVMFQCHAPDCGAEFWEWFEWLSKHELITFAETLDCPECGSDNWELTDTSNFAGGQWEGEAGYPYWIGQASTIYEARADLGITRLAERVTALEARLGPEPDAEQEAE